MRTQSKLLVIALLATVIGICNWPPKTHSAEITRPPIYLRIQEIDGSPTATPTLLKVSNGTLTLNGDGSLTLAIGATQAQLDGKVNSAPGGLATNLIVKSGLTVLSGLFVQGGAISAPINTYSTTPTQLSGTSDFTALINAASAAITVRLPLAGFSANEIMFIKKIDSTANPVTITTLDSALIDGQASRVISQQWGGVQIHCDGTNWFTL